MVFFSGLWYCSMVITEEGPAFVSYPSVWDRIFIRIFPYATCRAKVGGNTSLWNIGRVQLERDGTRWHTVGEVKGKLANGVDGQYPSHYLGTRCIQHYYRWWRAPQLQVVDWTDTHTHTPADLNGLIRFAERRNLVSAHVPSRFSWPLLHSLPENCCLVFCVS